MVFDIEFSVCYNLVGMRIFIAIGGGELRTKETAQIDRFIASKATANKERRGVALFFPTASHDSLPYFNTFRKTYTSDYGLKAEVALLTKKDIPPEKIKEKTELADVIYIGGGDTVHMLDVFKKTGTDKLIDAAYERGAVLAGLSAGAVGFFKQMYTDSKEEGKYSLFPGLGYIDALVCPHYEKRREDFLKSIPDTTDIPIYGIEGRAALVFCDGKLVGALSAGGAAYNIYRSPYGYKEEKIALFDENFN